MELLDGQFIITDRQAKRLRDVGMDAVADAIAKTAAARRKEIMGDAPAPESEPATKADTPAQTAVNKPVSASEDAIPMEWAEAKPSEVSRQKSEVPPEQMSPQAFKALRKDEEGINHSPAVTEYEQKGRIQQAIKEDRPMSALAAAYYGLKITSPDASPSLVSPEVKQRTAEIAAFVGDNEVQSQRQKAKLTALLKVADGKKLIDFSDEELRSLGLNRDGTPGHYERKPVDKKDPSKGYTREWKPGPPKDPLLLLVS